MPENVYSISRKKVDELYATVDGNIMDARVNLMVYLKEKGIGRDITDKIDEIMYECNKRTASKAIQVFKKKT
jgi:hypothetical protein